MHSKKEVNEKSQSSIEYIVIYGIAILIIAAVIVIITTSTAAPNLIVPSSCNFVDGLSCHDIIVETNAITHSTTIALALSNPLSYAVYNTIVFTNIAGQNSVGTSCLPSYVPPGGSIVCIFPADYNSIVNQFVSGTIYANLSYCGLSLANQQGQCNSETQEYVAYFTSHAQPDTSAPQISLTVIPASPYAYINGPPDKVTAELKITGYPVQNEEISFTENDPIYSVNPSLSLTDSAGDAVSYVSGTTVGNDLITATFSDVSANTVVQFISPGTPPQKSSTTTTSTSTTTSSTTSTSTTSSTTSSSTSSSTSTTTTIKAQTVYTLTTEVLPAGSGNVLPVSGNYIAGNTIDIAANPYQGYTFNDWTCTGTGCYSGTSNTANFIISSNTVEIAHLNVIPYPGELAPFSCSENNTFDYSAGSYVQGDASGSGTPSVSVISDKYRTTPYSLNYGEQLYDSTGDSGNTNMGTISKGGYVYVFESFSNSTSSNYAISIINTSKTEVVKTIIIQNSTLDNPILGNQQYSYPWLSFNSSGALSILVSAGYGSFGGLTQVSPNYYMIVVNNTVIQNTLASNKFYNIYSGIPTINLTSQMEPSYYYRVLSSTSSPYSLVNLGSYIYISIGANVIIYNTMTNSVARNMQIVNNTLYQNSYITNLASNGGYVFANINYANYSNGMNTIDVIRAINTTTISITNTIVSNEGSGNLPDNTSYGILMNNELSEAYVVLENSTNDMFSVVTLSFGPNGQGRILNVQHFTNSSYSPYAIGISTSIGEQNYLQQSANDSLLYVQNTFTNVGGSGYTVLNLQSGMELGDGIQYPTFSRVCYQPNNYNIYYTSSTPGVLPYFSTAYETNSTVQGIPKNQTAVAILLNQSGSNLYIGGDQTTPNPIYYDQVSSVSDIGFTGIVNTSQNKYEPQFQTNPAQKFSFFMGSEVPLTAVSVVEPSPEIFGLSYPNAQYFTYGPYGVLGTYSQVQPVSSPLSSLDAGETNTTSSICGPSSTNPTGCYSSKGIIITSALSIVAFSGWASNPQICTAAGYYGLATVPFVTIYGTVVKNGNLYVVSQQNVEYNNQESNYAPSLFDAPSGMGASAATAVFSSLIHSNKTNPLSIITGGGGGALGPGGSGSPGNFYCDISKSSFPFVTSTYDTVAGPSEYGLPPANTAFLGPVVTSGSTDNLYMFNDFNNSLSLEIFNTQTNTSSDVALPGNTINSVPPFRGEFGNGYQGIVPSILLSDNSSILFIDYASTNSTGSEVDTLIGMNATTHQIIFDKSMYYGYLGADGQVEMAMTPDGKYLFVFINGGTSEFSIPSLIKNYPYALVAYSGQGHADNQNIASFANDGANPNTYSGPGYVPGAYLTDGGPHGNPVDTQNIAITPNIAPPPT